MKTLRNMLMFMLTYIAYVTFIYILVYNKLSWFDVAQNAGSACIGAVIAFIATVSYSFEQTK